MYVHRLFFRPDATPYQTLGLVPGASPEAVKESFRLLMQLVHPDRQDEMAQWPDAFAAQANRAYGVLRNEDSRAQFDRDAASRAAMERAMQRADTAPAASKAAFVQRPQRRSASEPSAAMQLPAWLTEGVGGYVRKHPAVTAFTLFTAVALVTVGIVVSDQQEDRLTRDARDVQASPAPKARPGAKALLARRAPPTRLTRQLPTLRSGRSLLPRCPCEMPSHRRWRTAPPPIVRVRAPP
jgi:curved DNA-binding protein CbpA